MPILADTASIAVRGFVTASGGQVRKVINVFSYQHTGGPGPPYNPTSFATAFDLHAWSFIAPFLSTDYLGDAYLWYLDPLLSPPGLVTGQASPNGGTAGGREPISSCVNLWGQTGLRGKSFRCVKRFGPIPTSSVSKDELTPAVQAALQIQVNRLLTPFTDGAGDSWSPVILSRQLSSVGPPVVFVGAPLLSLTVNRTLGIARHRRERTVQ